MYCISTVYLLIASCITDVHHASMYVTDCLCLGYTWCLCLSLIVCLYLPTGMGLTFKLFIINTIYRKYPRVSMCARVWATCTPLNTALLILCCTLTLNPAILYYNCLK